MESSQNVETELAALNFTVMNRYYTLTDHGHIANYLKVKDLKGQILFVYLDAPGMICEGGVCHSIQSITPSNHHIDDVPLSVAGLGLECNDSVCMIVRKPDGIETQTFGQPFDNRADIEYPIVRLSELRVNPVETLKSASNVYMLRKNNSFNHAIQKLEVMNKSLMEYHRLTMLFYDKVGKLADGLRESLRNLNGLLERYNQKTIMDRGEQVTYAKIFSNIQIRNNDLDVLVKLINNFVRDTNVVANIEMLQVYIKELDERLVYVDRFVE